MKIFVFITICLSLSFALAFDLKSESDFYRQRYGLTDVYTKRVDNEGNGFEELYGTRNFRVVLQGVLYRGGANNVYNKYKKRANQNPLQNHGLENLCQDGFATGVYLYTTNYSTAPTQTSCRNLRNENSTLNYKQISSLEEKNHPALIELIYKRIQGQLPGPIYSHCWNGWHASGLVSAISLIQFCNYTNQQALDYWIANTDGHSSGYDSVKSMIRNFKKLPQFQITKDQSNAICVR